MVNKNNKVYKNYIVTGGHGFIIYEKINKMIIEPINQIKLYGLGKYLKELINLSKSNISFLSINSLKEFNG